MIFTLTFFRRTGLAKMIDNGKGVLWIRGKFKDNLPNPYFRVSAKLYIPSTLNINLILWHTQLNPYFRVSVKFLDFVYHSE